MPKQLKKWGRRLLLGAVVLVLAGWSGGAWLLRRCVARPPPLPADVSIMQRQPEVRAGRTWLGQSWVARREGLLVVRLKGSPFELGYAAGQLLPEQIHTLENEFLAMIRGYVPQPWKVSVLKSYVLYANRHLSDFVAADYRQQIHGTIRGCPDRHPELGDYYNRMLNYHAAHDVSYLLIDNPLVARAGCTAFGAWGGATPNQHLLTGRNFDWEAAEVFGRDRVVILCEPDGGIPFISLAWAGMTGVVSGLNRAGVSVTLNGAPSRLPGDTATPVAMVARDVLQQAHNLAEALAIIRRAPVFVSTLWLVGSRADGKFIVVEKTPAATQVREPDGDAIICANHFQTAGLRDDARNQEYVAEATSASRFRRLTELVRDAHGTLDPARAVEMLRDRRLPGGTFAGNGHRATLNAFIATHATVMDLTDGIFWAASPPHQLGKFVAFDVHDFDRELPALTVAADLRVTSGEFAKTQLAHQALAAGHRALQSQDAATALAAAAQAEAANPGFYRNAALRGRALQQLGRGAEAARAFETALAQHPALRSEQHELEGWLHQVRGRK